MNKMVLLLFCLWCLNTGYCLHPSAGEPDSTLSSDEYIEPENEKCECTYKRFSFGFSFIFNDDGLSSYYMRGYSGYGRKSCFLGACNISGQSKLQGGNRISVSAGYNFLPRWEANVSFITSGNSLDAIKGQIKSVFYGVDSSDYLEVHDDLKFIGFPAAVYYNLPICNSEKAFAVLSFMVAYVPQWVILKHDVRIFHESPAGYIQSSDFEIRKKYFRSGVSAGFDLKVLIGKNIALKFSLAKFLGQSVYLDEEIYASNYAQYTIKKREILFYDLNIGAGINVFLK